MKREILSKYFTENFTKVFMRSSVSHTDLSIARNVKKRL